MKEMNPRAILRYMIWVLFRRKWSICLFFGFTMACFIFGTFLITPQWMASSKILVLQDPKQQMILFRDLEAPIPSDRGSSAMDIVEILRGNELASEVVKKFNLDERKRRASQEPKTLQERLKYGLVQVANFPFYVQRILTNSEAADPNFFEKALDDLIEEMQDIELIEETSTINLSIWADSPELAVDICNFMVQRLMEKTTGFERSEATQTYQFVTDQLKTVENALTKAEDELVAFKTRSKVVDLPTEKAMLLEQLDRVKSEVNSKETTLAALNATLQELKNQLGNPELAELPKISSPSTLVQSDATDRKSDPYKSLRNSLSEAEVEQSILQNQVQIARAKGELEILEGQLAQVQKDLQLFTDKELELTRLTRSSAGLQERYITLRQKQLELEVQKFTETSEFDIKVADSAYIPPRAETDWPKWGINIVVGVIFGMMFAVGQAFLFEYWRDTLREEQDVVSALDIDVLGSVKPVSLKRFGARLTQVAKG